MNIPETLKSILSLTLPYITQLIKSAIVPKLKRQMYEFVNKESDKLIKDLAQNASKIATVDNETKKAAYVEGTKLGLDTIRALADKLNKAADEIEKVLDGEKVL